MEYDEFLTPDERKQIDELMKKAYARRKKKMVDDASKHFLMLDCQCMCLKHVQEKEGKQDVALGCFELMKELLKAICEFCREHDCCVCQKNEDRRRDEELPFG